MRLEYSELLVLAFLNLAYVFFAARFVWNLAAKRSQVSHFGFAAWAAGGVAITIAKIYLLEYLSYVSRTHTHSEFSSYVAKLFIYEGQLLELLGLLAVESELMWRVTLYGAIIVVTTLATLPLAGLKMRPVYR